MLKTRMRGDRPLIMGILNVTPDSFSDGGAWDDPDAAVEHAFRMIDEGADIIDVGAESTRPGSDPVGAEEELSRLIPVLERLIPSVTVPISVDTMKARVASACIDMGVGIVNDVNGLRGEGMLEAVASEDVDVVIMHMEGVPKTMQDRPMTGGFMDTIKGFLAERVDAAVSAGVSKDRIVLDPGIGFGKTYGQNMAILSNASYFSDGMPVLIGASRKRFLAEYFPGLDADSASAEAAKIAVASGASILRVHNVARTVDALTGISET